MDINERMKKSIEALRKNFTTVRAGRASAEMLDRVKVEYYGSEVPIKQVASVSAADSRTLVVTPFDKTAISDIERGILKSDVGLTPMNDGHNIRLAIPMLTEERRRELDKLLKKNAEEARVSIRNIRRDVLDKYKKEDHTTDEQKGKQEEVQKITDSYIAQVDTTLKEKEAEIMEV
jgi:ribosome recycling factor